MVDAPDSNGLITISGTYPDVSNLADFPQSIDIPVDGLLYEDLVLEVHVEIDGSWDSPEYFTPYTVVLRGEDIIE